MIPYLWIVRANAVRQTGEVDESYSPIVRLPRSFLGLVLNGTGHSWVGTIWKEADGTWNLRTSDAPKLVRVYAPDGLGELLHAVPRYCLLLVDREVFKEMSVLRTQMGFDGLVHTYDGELATSGNPDPAPTPPPANNKHNPS